MYAIPPLLHYGAHRIDIPLPASMDDDGLMMTVWRLSQDDKDKVICGGHIRLWVYTNEYSLPVCIEVMEPTDCVTKES